MSVGLAIIARNEEQRLPSLLASIDGAFDRVVLLDTGSKDKTVKVFQAWAQAQVGVTSAVGHYKWSDDFGHARMIADCLLTQGITSPGGLQKPLVDWTCWADCDDVICGAMNIRPLTERVGPEVVAFLVGYDYSQADDGSCISYLWRERMVRTGHGTWTGRVHEAQTIEGGAIQPVIPSQLEWRHSKHVEQHQAGTSNKRNLRILRAWLKQEPKNPRVLSYLGIEEWLCGPPRYKLALRYFKRYLAENPDWTEEHAQVLRRISVIHNERGEFSEAIGHALEAVMLLPTWPDSYITLAESYLLMGEGEKAAEWARQAIERGAPKNTLLILNPTDYTFLPKKLLAGALAAQGDYDGALAIGKEAVVIHEDGALVQAMHQWQSIAKRTHTADTHVAIAEQLIAHDEQLKALKHLEECLPVFVQDHPKLVGLRSALRQRLLWVNDAEAFADHYKTGGSKPEDFVKDENIDKLCDYLPRTNFLRDGIMEQAEAT